MADPGRRPKTELKKEGVSDYITKPFKKEDLILLIR